MTIKGPGLTIIKPDDESLLNSKMHSHCFVRVDSIYTPIALDDERQKYQSLPCFKGIEEVAKFYQDISSNETDIADNNSTRVNEISLQVCLQTIRRCEPKSLHHAK